MRIERECRTDEGSFLYFQDILHFLFLFSGRHQLHLGYKWAGIRRHRYPRAAAERLHDDFFSYRYLSFDAKHI